MVSGDDLDVPVVVGLGGRVGGASWSSHPRRDYTPSPFSAARLSFHWACPRNFPHSENLRGGCICNGTTTSVLLLVLSRWTRSKGLGLN